MILSGGSGTRLWPLSSPRRPKQLHALVGRETMLQATVQRARAYEAMTAPIVVCNGAQVGEVERQLAEIGEAPQSIVVEPVGRNTAPAIAAAALLVEPQAVVVVLPADHVIENGAAFSDALGAAVAAATEGHLVAFGVVPTRSDTGFGYIAAVGTDTGEARVIERFVEKPDRATAGRLVEEGCLWNAGMFVFRAATVLEELERWEPDVLRAVAESLPSQPRGRVIHLGRRFSSAPAISIDKAVMERTDRARVVALDAGWSDVGSWQALWEVVSEDGGTVTEGEVLAIDVERSYIRSESKPVAVIGLDDVVVVETPEAVLVVDRRRAQDVREAADWHRRRHT